MTTPTDPDGWALAAALEEQIRNYRSSAMVVQMTDAEIDAMLEASAHIFGRRDGDVEWSREQAHRRLAEPVVDIDAAREKANAIMESGGWSSFTRPEVFPGCHRCQPEAWPCEWERRDEGEA